VPGGRWKGWREVTKVEAVALFRAEVLPLVIAKYGPNDKPALREAWNDWTDGLCKSREITPRQYDTWCHPF